MTYGQPTGDLGTSVVLWFRRTPRFNTLQGRQTTLIRALLESVYDMPYALEFVSHACQGSSPLASGGAWLPLISEVPLFYRVVFRAA